MFYQSSKLASSDVRERRIRRGSWRGASLSCDTGLSHPGSSVSEMSDLGLAALRLAPAPAQEGKVSDIAASVAAPGRGRRADTSGHRRGSLLDAQLTLPLLISSH